MRPQMFQLGSFALGVAVVAILVTVWLPGPPVEAVPLALTGAFTGGADSPYTDLYLLIIVLTALQFGPLVLAVNTGLVRRASRR